MNLFTISIKRSLNISIAYLLTSFLFYGVAFSAELKIKEFQPVQLTIPKVKKPGQIPHSRIATGKNNIATAWFAGETKRYAHGILGDTIEASTLIIETSSGKVLQVNLPSSRVFEDLEPRLIDLNKDEKDEIIVIESEISLGASLSIYGVESNQLVRITSTPFLGRPNRWLNPVGVGDFDGDGLSDVALVATPHIGGILRLYQFIDSELILFGEYPGVSNHKIGSKELGLGAVVKGDTKDLLVLPDQAHRVLLLLEWRKNGLKEISKVELPNQLRSSLKIIKSNHWYFQLINGQVYELYLKY